MTREEAIKELQESHDIMRSYDIDESESRLMTALDMAIKAIKSIDAIKADISMYESDCRLSDSMAECAKCNDNVFGSIYRIIDRHTKGGERMTNQEAIKIISQMIKDEEGFLSDDTVEAHKMAIKALEQEPCEDEYIKVPKKALKYRTAGMVAYNVEWLKNHFDIERAVICGAQEPKTGHWIMSDDGLYRPICDKCGAHPWKGYIPTVEEATEVFKYCPNCGARMFEPQESEEV